MRRLLIALVAVMFSGCVIQFRETPPPDPWADVATDAIQALRDVLQPR